MLAGILSRLTYANVVASLALFVALGAGAYAAGLAPNSVLSKHIKNENVKTGDIAPGAVTSSRLAPNSIHSGLVPDNELVGSDIDESTLTTVPGATSAASAGDANLLDGKDSTLFQAIGSEGWIPLTLNDLALPIGCSWSNFGGGFANASYFRDGDGIVHLRGVVKANDGSSGLALPCSDPLMAEFAEFIALTDGLPPGYRPVLRSLFAATSNNKPARIDVLANGSILAQPGYPTTADTKVWVSLDGISFRCGPSGSNGCP